MALPLPHTPTDVGALTPNTLSEAEAAFTVGPPPHPRSSPISIQNNHSPNSHDGHHPIPLHTSIYSSSINVQFNALHQTASSGPPKPFVSNPEFPMHRRESHNYLDAANEAGLPPSACEPPYPTEQTAQQVKGNLSRGTTQAILEKMNSITKTNTNAADDTTKSQHCHVTIAGQSTGTGPEQLDGGILNKRLSREGHRRTSSITVPVSTSFKTTSTGTGDENAIPDDYFQKPTFDRSTSWKREDQKRTLYQREKLMEEERRNGKNYGYDSAGEEEAPRHGQF